MPSPFEPNLKLEALHATVALEKARLESGDNASTNEQLVKDMTSIHAWLVGTE